MGAAAASRRTRAAPRNSGVGKGSGWGSWPELRRGEGIGGGTAEAGAAAAARPAGARGAGGWPAAPAFAAATEAGEAAGQVGFGGSACAVLYGTVKLLEM
jgi:hypothetical protein